MYGGGMGTLNVYADQRPIFAKSGNQGQGWKMAEIEISKQGNYEVQLKNTEEQLQQYNNIMPPKTKQ